MKRRHLLTALVAILLIFTSVACSNNAAAPEDKVGRIIVGDNSRAVGTVVQYSNDVEDLIWFYKATKLDDGYTTGKANSLTLVRELSSDSPQAGLSGQTLNGNFSYGLWTIELEGYKVDNVENNAPKDNASPEYTSKIENLLVDSNVNNATAKIEVGKKAETTIEFGEISFSAANIKENSSFTLAVTDTKGTVAVPDKYTSSGAGTSENTNPKITVADNVGTVTYGGLTYTLNGGAEITGDHEMKFVLTQKLSGTNNTSIDAALYTLKFTVNKGTKTTISGTLLKNDQTGTIKINSVQDVEPITLSRAIPVDNIDSTHSVAKVSTATTITVGNMTIELPQGTVIATTSGGLSTDGTGTAGTSDATVGFKSTDTSSGIVINGGESVMSYELTLPVSTSTTEGQKNTQLVTVKNFIGKGLNITDIKHAGTSIKVKENETVPTDGNEGYYYNSESGYLTLYVFHASEFNIITKKVAATVGSTNYYTFEEAVTAATGEGVSATTIKLADDVSISKALTINKDLTVDLNGKTLSFEVTTNEAGKGAFELADSDSAYTVKFSNGTIKGTMTGSKTNVFSLHKNATLNLDGVTMEATSFRGIQVYQNTDPATVNIENSTIKVTGAYAVSTEASTAADGSTSKNVTIKIEKSTLETLSKDDDNTALLVNVPSTVTITGSTIKGARQGAVLRGGSTTISGSTFSSTGSKTNYNSEYGDYLDCTWSSGNEVPLAAIVIGNRNGSYKYHTTVEFKESNTLTVGENSVRKQLYVYQADKLANEADDLRTVKVTGNVNPKWTINDNMNGATYPAE